jgi:Sulfotransferase domain
MTLPNFLVIGAQRAGTSLLHQILLAHPDVYVPGQRKEVHYFDRYFERGVEWYQSYFPAADAAGRYLAIGEITPDYLATEEAPARIHALLPACRLIVMLRNPVDRVYSWYQHARRSRNERRDFATFLEEEPGALRAGLYHRHLRSYLALFPRESLLVLLYEELLRDPGGELGRLTAFLGVEMVWSNPAALLQERIYASETPRFRQGFALARRAGGFLARHDLNWPVRTAKRIGVRRWFGRSSAAPALSVAERARLAAYYQDDVRQLRGLLRRELDVWQA